MYKVKVVGSYIARSGVMDKEKIRKNYEIEGNIPSITAALSVVKNKLLGPTLAAKYTDYVTFLTYNIIEITPLTPEAKVNMGKIEVQFMSRGNLLAFIKEHALSVKADYYPDLFKLREAVQYAKDDPKGYLKHFEIQEPDLRLDLEMAKCNPQLFGADSSGLVASVSLPSGPSGSTTRARTKASSPENLNVKTEDRLAGLKADQVRDGEMAEMDNGLGDL